MKRLSCILLTGLLLFSCKEAQDTRFFAPELEFEAASYSVTSDGGGADVSILLSRPAPVAFQIGLNFGGSLQEGVHFTVPSHSLNVPQGASQAGFHIDLIDDEIWDEESWIDVALSPGSRYTVNPQGKCMARVQVKKTLVLPVLTLTLEEGNLEMNPFLPEPLLLRISTPRGPQTDLDVELSLADFVAGKDYLVEQEPRSQVKLPAGATSLVFRLDILRKDLSGYDKTIPVTMVPVAGKYGVATEGGSVDLHLSDPLVDFKSLWRTSAQVGEGYQVRQAIKNAAGEWNGNLAANWKVSAEGSNYLRSLRNMSSATFGCMSNEVGLHILRLAEFFPNLRKTSGDAIADYGNNSNTRGFSPVDSLFRFVLDPGSTTKGQVLLGSPRTFTAFTGDYTTWHNGWKDDSKATGGDIFASTSPAITGRVDLTLVKLEGRFDLSDSNNTLLFTAWFSCAHPEFMKDVNFENLAAVKEGELWKVEYKLWPR